MVRRSNIISSVAISFLFLIGSVNALADNPDNMVVVDTGYDLCMQQHGSDCAENKNLLIRGSQPIDQKQEFNREGFQQKTLSAIMSLRQQFELSANIPSSLTELKNYRIVMISLLAGYSPAAEGKKKERLELGQEFQLSGVSEGKTQPDQHHLYGLDVPFERSQYAIEWWPITLMNQGIFDKPYTISMLNWPDNKNTPKHHYLPRVYLRMDFPYLITNQSYLGKVNEPLDAASLPALLRKIPADGHPLLIYYHCVAGKDRTGVVTMAYYITHGGYPFVAVAADKKMTRSQPMNLISAKKAALSAGGQANTRAQKLAKIYFKYHLSH